MTDEVTNQPLLPLVDACEAAFEEHGDTYLGVGWTKSQENAELRYQVMLDVVRPDGPAPATLLDLGCGASHLLEHIHRSGADGIVYSGLDVSKLFIDVSRAKFPDVDYYLGDIHDSALAVPVFDYVVMNGVFTYKGPLSFDQMVRQWERLVTAAIAHARVGVVFNTSSPYVDWQRDDLFHPPMSVLTDFMARSACPYFVVRHDYGLYETAVYAYRAPAVSRRPRAGG